MILLNEVFSASVKYLQILDESGNIDQALFPKELDDNKIIEMYKYMNFARAVDAKVLSMQRQGRAVTYAPLVGEEATQVGSGYAMRKNDFFVPTFRQHALFLMRGLPLESFIISARGFEDGAANSIRINGTSEIVPVASQLPHAAGIAYAKKFNNEDSVVIAYVGDGGTSEGDFYETMNFAGRFKVPLVIIIENNQWAISVPRSAQTAATTLAQKAVAAGIIGMQVDGNDVIAVYKATKDAIENARNGPTLIEAITYRMSMHTTADDPTKYRPESDVESWKPKDPILRVRKYLLARNAWNNELENNMHNEQSKIIDEAVAKAEEFRVDPKKMFENIYSFIPEVLKEEEDDAMASNFWQGEV